MGPSTGTHLKSSEYLFFLIKSRFPTRNFVLLWHSVFNPHNTPPPHPVQQSFCFPNCAAFRVSLDTDFQMVHIKGWRWQFYNFPWTSRWWTVVRVWLQDMRLIKPHTCELDARRCVNLNTRQTCEISIKIQHNPLLPCFWEWTVEVWLPHWISSEPN